jgi:hypothetical protein
VYIGLLSTGTNTNKGSKDASDDDDEDFEEEMAASNPTLDAFDTDVEPYPLIDPSEVERRLETKEERAMRLFLANPERALKIFFTSYFIDKGLMW